MTNRAALDASRSKVKQSEKKYLIKSNTILSAFPPSHQIACKDELQATVPLDSGCKGCGSSYTDPHHGVEIGFVGGYKNACKA